MTCILWILYRPGRWHVYYEYYIGQVGLSIAQVNLIKFGQSYILVTPVLDIVKGVLVTPVD